MRDHIFAIVLSFMLIGCPVDRPCPGCEEEECPAEVEGDPLPEESYTQEEACGHLLAVCLPAHFIPSEPLDEQRRLRSDFVSSCITAGWMAGRSRAVIDRCLLDWSYLRQVGCSGPAPQCRWREGA